MRLLSFLIACILLTACTAAPQTLPVTGESAALPSPAVEEFVVFHAAQAEEFVSTLTGEKVSGGWTPTTQDIANLEAQLQQPPAKTDLRPLSDYKRQFAGYTANGQRMLLGNYFCETHNINWKIAPLIVLDGGNCFFQVKYNADTQQILEIVVNGEA